MTMLQPIAIAGKIAMQSVTTANVHYNLSTGTPPYVPRLFKFAFTFLLRYFMAWANGLVTDLI